MKNYEICSALSIFIGIVCFFVPGINLIALKVLSLPFVLPVLLMILGVYVFARGYDKEKNYTIEIDEYDRTKTRQDKIVGAAVKISTQAGLEVKRKY